MKRYWLPISLALFGAGITLFAFNAQANIGPAGLGLPGGPLGGPMGGPMGGYPGVGLPGGPGGPGASPWVQPGGVRGGTGHPLDHLFITRDPVMIDSLYGPGNPDRLKNFYRDLEMARRMARTMNRPGQSPTITEDAIWQRARQLYEPVFQNRAAGVMNPTVGQNVAPMLTGI